MREGGWFAPIAAPAINNENTVLLNIVQNLCGVSVLTYNFSIYMVLAPKPIAVAFTSKSKGIRDKWEYGNLPKLGPYEG